MSLIRWEPYSGADDMFERLAPSLFGRWPRLKTTGNGDGGVEWAPSADISETDKEFLIRAELPAVKKEDVKVSFDRGTLTIEGERKHHKEEKGEKFHRMAPFRGSFLRTFTLPDNVKAEAIRCESHDGVLTVHIPKMTAAVVQPRLIKIE